MKLLIAICSRESRATAARTGAFSYALMLTRIAQVLGIPSLYSQLSPPIPLSLKLVRLLAADQTQLLHGSEAGERS
jgi:hypothetical protein